MNSQHLPVDEILEFWFGGSTSDNYSRWFSSDPQFDELIRERFGVVVDAVIAKPPKLNQPRDLLAAVIVTDQFPRNLFRSTPRAFASDALALAYSRQAIDARLDQQLSVVERGFLYMPFQHAEDLSVQDLSVRMFENLAADASGAAADLAQGFAKYAHLHRDIVRRFGRFPHRNTILGRDTTDAEQAYLDGDAPRFGQ